MPLPLRTGRYASPGKHPDSPTFDEVRWTDGWDAFRLQGGPAWDKLLDAMINLARHGAPLES